MSTSGSHGSGVKVPVRATTFAAESPPAREVLAGNRIMKSGGEAVVATLGAAGVEVAQSLQSEKRLSVPNYLTTDCVA